MKRAASQFPTGVVVAAAQMPEGRVGLTLQSFVSLSLDPPLVQLSIARHSESWSNLQLAGSFSLSILSSSQADIAVQFASRARDRFGGVTAHPGPVTGHPLIAGAVAWFECAIEAIHPGGDHDIVVGRVLGASTNTEVADPLVYQSSGFARILGTASARAVAPG